MARPAGTPASAGRVRSPRKKSRNPAYSTAMAASQGSAMAAVKLPRLSPLTVNASRLVRFDTGSSSDAELARCAQAYIGGRGRSRSRAVVSCTTGVSSTTVVSRLSTAVVTEASANVPVSSRTGSRPLHRASRAPAAVNRPSASHS